MTRRVKTYAQGVEGGYRKCLKDVRRLIKDYKTAFANGEPNIEFAANVRDAATYIELLIKRMVSNRKSAQRRKGK